MLRRYYSIYIRYKERNGNGLPNSHWLLLWSCRRFFCASCDSFSREDLTFHFTAFSPRVAPYVQRSNDNLKSIAGYSVTSWKMLEEKNKQVFPPRQVLSLPFSYMFTLCVTSFADLYLFSTKEWIWPFLPCSIVLRPAQGSQRSCST
jgi:hypothetical protein